MSLKTSLQKGLYLRLEQWTWQTAASSSSLVRIFPPNLRKTSSLCSIAHARWAIGRSDYDFTRAFWNRSKGWELLGVAGPQPTPTRHQLPLTEDEFKPVLFSLPFWPLVSCQGFWTSHSQLPPPFSLPHPSFAAYYLLGIKSIYMVISVQFKIE